MNRGENLHYEQQDNRARLEKIAGEIGTKSESLPWQIAQLIKMLKNPKMRPKARGLISGYLFEYYKSARTKSPEEINVELPVDSKIPFRQELLSAYISHVGLVISGVNFIHGEFGEEADEELEKFAADIVALFPEAAQIYRSIQTRLHREGKGGLGIKALRMVDNDKNASPSIHAEVVALAYSRISDIIDKHAKGRAADYEPIKNIIFRRAVKILEAVLLVKQHAVMDIGVGFAVLSRRDKSFANGRAEQLVNAMFQENNCGMDPETVNEIHAETLSIYNEVKSKLDAEPATPLPQVIVGYLKEFDAKTHPPK